jgi:hypothetical protein
MATLLDRVLEARHTLEEALTEQDGAEVRFASAIGTSTETRAYQRLRRATRRVAEADSALKRAEATPT